MYRTNYTEYRQTMIRILTSNREYVIKTPRKELCKIISLI